MRRRPEKQDRDRMKEALKCAGCRYIRTNHGTQFSSSRPDLEGIAADGIFFGVEMKAEDVVLTYPAITAKQDAELREIALAGGRACAARLQHDGPGIQVDVLAYTATAIDASCGSLNVLTRSRLMPFAEFLVAILTGKGWP